MSVGTGEGGRIAHPVAGLEALAAREQPQPVRRGQEVTPWILGWLAGRGAAVEVADAVRARDALGRQRYGQPLCTGDGRDVVADLVQELADALQYAASARLQRRGEEARAATAALLTALCDLLDEP